MRRRTRWDLTGSVAVGLLLVAAGACSAPSGEHGGSGASGTTTKTDTSTGTQTIDPPCSGPLGFAADARFAPTSGPANARFEHVAATPDVVIASTGEGLHRSKDGGETWSLVTDKGVRGVRIRAAAALGSELFVSTDTSVLRTTDGGETWTDTSSASFVSPAYLSAHGAELYALDMGKPYAWDAATSTWKAIPAEDEFFDVLESDGSSLYANSLYNPGVMRYRLDQPSAGWTPVESLPEWGYRAFAFMPGRGIASNVNNVFQSMDDGATWSTVGSGFEASDLLAVGDAVFAATTKGLLVSNDKGSTWTTSFDASFLHARFSLASDGEHVFAATDGLRRAKLGGTEWTKLHVLADYVTYLFPTEKSVFAYGASGLHRTADGGASWSDTSLPLSSAYYWGTPFARHGGKLFAVEDMKSIAVSTDDGATFTPIELPSQVAGAYRTPSLLASIDGALILGVYESAGYGCSNAVDTTMTLYRSTDEGKTWSAGENNLPKLFTDCYGVSTPPAVRSLVQHGKALLAVTWHDGAFRSSDGGASWASVGSYRRFLSAGDVLFAASTEGGLARSTDDGVTFSPSAFDGLEVYALAAADGLAFASVGEKNGVDGAMYASSDAGVTWTRVDAGFDARVDALAFLGDKLFVGTHDQSVWTLSLTCQP
jgi:photosystem II stability/assembly factor-like uncharacterized protein